MNMILERECMTEKETKETEVINKLYIEFEPLVKAAEKFIVQYAKKILVASRSDEKQQSSKINNAIVPKTELNSNNFNNDEEEYAIKCYELLNEKNRYCPRFIVKDDKLYERNNLDHSLILDDVIMLFCQEMQNFRYMRGINYNKYNYRFDKKEIVIDYKNNLIYTTVKTFYDEKIQNELESYFDEDKNVCINENSYYINLYNELHSKIRFKQDSKRANGDKYKKSWDKYAKSLMDMIIQIYQRENILKEKYVEFVERICKGIENSIDDEKKIEEKINEFNGEKDESVHKISLFGPALTYDFLKELACENLVKADYHIEEIFKTIAKKTEHKKPSKTKLTRYFIDLCKKYQDEYGGQYTPFYIDKMFWLCCTGNFYADGITIAKMTRNNFLRFAGFAPIQDEDEEQEE